jgi:hypothetical protein
MDVEAVVINEATPTLVSKHLTDSLDCIDWGKLITLAHTERASAVLHVLGNNLGRAALVEKRGERSLNIDQSSPVYAPVSSRRGGSYFVTR